MTIKYICRKSKPIEKFDTVKTDYKDKTIEGCEGSQVQLDCGENWKIYGGFVYFGQWDATCDSSFEKNISSQEENKLVNVFGSSIGQQTASVTVNPQNFGSDPAPGKKKKFNIKYRCQTKIVTKDEVLSVDEKYDFSPPPQQVDTKDTKDKNQQKIPEFKIPSKDDLGKSRIRDTSTTDSKENKFFDTSILDTAFNESSFKLDDMMKGNEVNTQGNTIVNTPENTIVKTQGNTTVINGEQGNKNTLIIGIGAGVCICITLICVLFFLFRNKE